MLPLCLCVRVHIPKARGGLCILLCHVPPNSLKPGIGRESEYWGVQLCVIRLVQHMLLPVDPPPHPFLQSPPECVDTNYLKT